VGQRPRLGGSMMVVKTLSSGSKFAVFYTGISSADYLKPLLSVSLRPASTSVSGNYLDDVAPAERLQVGKKAFTPYGKVH